MKVIAEFFVNAVGVDTIQYLIALPILGVTNILEGALLGKMKGQLNKEIFIKGIIKFSGTYLVIFLIVVAGALVSDKLFVIAGQNTGLIEMVKIGVVGMFGLYALKVGQNFYKLMQVEINIENAEKDIEEVEVND